MENSVSQQSFKKETPGNLRSLQVPIIGALKGPVIGAGACLATGGCDLRIAEPSTKIAFNFVKIGLHPGKALNLKGKSRRGDLNIR